MRVDAGNRPPVPVIATPTATQQFSVGEVLTLSGSASDPDDGPLADVDLTWEVRQHHHTHFHPYLDPTVGNNITVVAPEPEDFDSTQDSYIEVRPHGHRLQGPSTTVSQAVQPSTVNLTFRTAPTGFDLVIEGQTFTAPTTVVGWKDWKIEDRGAGPARQLGCPVRLDFLVGSTGADARDHRSGSSGTYTATFVHWNRRGRDTWVRGRHRNRRRFGRGRCPGSRCPSPADTGHGRLGDRGTGGPGIATAGVDYVAASGTVTFAPGETSQTVPITVLGDTIDEPPLLSGEWGLVSFSNPSANATLDTSFYGLGVFVIVDNDPPHDPSGGGECRG